MSGTEEAPSSMVSSEAESEGSVVSESRHETALADQDSSFLDKTATDVRAVGSTLASLVSTRGIAKDLYIFECIYNNTYIYTFEVTYSELVI